MNKTLIAATVTIFAVELFALIQARSPRGLDGQTFGLVSILCCVITFFTGIILLFIKRTKTIGEGILLGTALILLIGLFLCGTSSFR